MNSTLLEYMKIHRISLWQDLNELELEMDLMDINSDEYKFKDVEHISKSGQIIAMDHIIRYAQELDISDNLDLTSPFTKE